MAELQRRSSKVLEKRSLKSLLKVRNLYQASTTLGLEPVSIVHYTRPGSSIKRPTPNYLATQRHVNWPVVYPESSYKIMDPVSAALPPKSSKNLRCNSEPGSTRTCQSGTKRSQSWFGIRWTSSKCWVKEKCNLVENSEKIQQLTSSRGIQWDGEWWWQS